MTGSSTKKLKTDWITVLRSETRRFPPPPATAIHLKFLQITVYPDTANAVWTTNHAGQLSFCDLAPRILFLVVANTLMFRHIGPPSEMMKATRNRIQGSTGPWLWVDEGAWIWTCNRINIWDRRELGISVWLSHPAPFLKSFSSHRWSNWHQIWSKSWPNFSPIHNSQQPSYNCVLLNRVQGPCSSH